MNATPDLAVVIPAFNEVARLPRTLDTVRRYLSASTLSWEIRVVDDGSTDGTPEAVAAAAASDPRIVLQREPHRGKGGAVRAGMLASQSRLRFLCDADLSMPIEEIARFLEQVPAAADIAIGCRESEGARRVGEPARRHSMGRGFNWLVRQLILPRFQDTQCGFKMFSDDAARQVFGRTSLDGWAFDVEALFIADRLGLRIDVVPITWHYAPESRVSPLCDALRMAGDVLRVRMNAWRGDYRLHKS